MGQKLISQFDLEILSQLYKEVKVYSFKDINGDFLPPPKFPNVDFEESLSFNMHAKYSVADSLLALIKTLIYKIPFNVAKSYDLKYEKILIRSLKKFEPQVIYFDHIGHLPYLKAIKKEFKSLTYVYKAHDLVADVFNELAAAEKNWLKRKYFEYNYRVSLVMDKYTLQEVHKVLFINDLVKDRFIEVFGNSEKYIKNTAQYLGHFRPYEERKIKEVQPDKSFVILTVGSWNYIPNFNGINWFIKEVFPKLKESLQTATLVIAGEKSECFDSPQTGVFGLGRVESLSDLYDKADCFVVPLFQGSGLRLKIVEATRNYKPIISTSKGFDGIDYIHNNHILVADDSHEFLIQLKRLAFEVNLAESLVENAYKYWSDSKDAKWIEPLAEL